MAEAFGIACYELVSLDFRCGSQPEVSDGHENVGFRGQSGSRFRAVGCLLVAKNGLSPHHNSRNVAHRDAGGASRRQQQKQSFRAGDVLALFRSTKIHDRRGYLRSR